MTDQLLQKPICCVFMQTPLIWIGCLQQRFLFASLDIILVLGFFIGVKCIGLLIYHCMMYVRYRKRGRIVKFGSRLACE